MTRKQELNVIKDFYALCVPSLCPEDLESFERVVQSLCDTRRNLCGRDDFMKCREAVGILVPPKI